LKAMILAAGLGTRLRPLTSEFPKALVPLNGRPLIEYTLLILRRYQFREVIINLHHQGEKIASVLGSGSRWGMRISYSREPDILGTGGGISHVRDQLMEGPFLIINGDVLIDVDLRRVAEFHSTAHALSTLILRKDENADRWGAVEINRDSRICRIRGKPSSLETGLEKRMFTGVHLAEPRIFDYLPREGYSNIMDAYIRMLESREPVMSYTMTGYWQDIGTVDRYRSAEKDLGSGKVRLSYLDETG
jgi:NDP-sugar pyrophosphorylase family protein